MHEKVNMDDSAMDGIMDPPCHSTGKPKGEYRTEFNTRRRKTCFGQWTKDGLGASGSDEISSEFARASVDE